MLDENIFIPVPSPSYLPCDHLVHTEGHLPSQSGIPFFLTVSTRNPRLSIADDSDTNPPHSSRMLTRKELLPSHSFPTQTLLPVLKPLLSDPQRNTESAQGTGLP